MKVIALKSTKDMNTEELKDLKAQLAAVQDDPKKLYEVLQRRGIIRSFTNYPEAATPDNPLGIIETTKGTEN